MAAPEGSKASPARRAAPWLAIMAACLLGAAWAGRPDGRLHVYFLDTPGDAVLIQTPAGRFALIDGGGDPAALATLLGRLMPFWRRDLRAVVLTRADGAHMPGQVAALARYRPDLAAAPVGMPSGGTAGEWRRLAGAMGVPLRPLRPGGRIDLGGGAGLRVLGAAPGDEGGAVLLVEYGAARVLIHGGGPWATRPPRSSPAGPWPPWPTPGSASSTRPCWPPSARARSSSPAPTRPPSRHCSATPTGGGLARHSTTRRMTAPSS